MHPLTRHVFFVVVVAYFFIHFKFHKVKLHQKQIKVLMGFVKIRSAYLTEEIIFLLVAFFIMR